MHKLETSGEEKEVYQSLFFSFVSYDLNSFLGKVQDRLEGEAIYFKERGVYLMNRLGKSLMISRITEKMNLITVVGPGPPSPASPAPW